MRQSGCWWARLLEMSATVSGSRADTLRWWEVPLAVTLWIPECPECLGWVRRKSLNVLQEQFRVLGPSNPHHFLAPGSLESGNRERLCCWRPSPEMRHVTVGIGHFSGCCSLWGSAPAVQHWHLSSLCRLSILTQLRTGLVMNLNSFETCPLFPRGKLISFFWIIEMLVKSSWH